MISLTIVIISILVLANFPNLGLKAQSEDIIDSNLRRPTTTQVIPEKYISQPFSNHNSSMYEIQPSISKIVSNGHNLESPLVINPSYTITNTTLTFGADVLEPEFTQKQTDISIFVANKSYEVIEVLDHSEQ